MKKLSLAVLAILVVLILSVPTFAAETTTVNVLGVELQLTAIDAILALLSGAVVTFLVQVVKTKLGSSGVVAFAITLVTCAGTTAAYFLVVSPMHPWSWLTYIVYTAAVLGESTGYYHLYNKISTKA